jgi:hypothetical protein
MWRTSLAVLLAAQAAASATTPPAALSQAKADSFARKLESLEGASRSAKGPRVVEVTEAELNSYLNLTMAGELPAGLTEVAIELERDQIHASASVDIDEVKKQMGSMSPWNPLTLLAGRVPIELHGRYSSAEDGFGRVDIEEARAAGVPIPITLLEQMVAGATRTTRDPDGFDIHAPFRLPHPVRRVRVMPGRALLDL